MKRYLIYSIIYFVGISLVFITNYNVPDSINGILLTSIMSLCYYISLLKYYHLTDYLPLFIYIIMSFIRIGIAGIFIAYTFSKDASLFLSPIFENGYNFIYIGSLIFVIGDLVFINACFFFHEIIKENVYRHSKYNEEKRNSTILKTGVILLIIYPILNIVEHYVIYANISTSIVIIAQLSGPAGLLLISIYKSNNKKLPFAVAIYVIVYIAIKGIILMSSLTKQEIIIHLIPLFYLIYKNISRKTIWKKAASAFIYSIIGTIIIITIFIYNSIYRNQINIGIEPDKQTQLFLLLDSIPFDIMDIISIEPDVLPEHLSDSGLLFIFIRSELYTPAAWVYNDVKNNGYKNDMIEKILMCLKPRILYPEKEQISFGADFAVELGQAKDRESATTGTTYGMFPAYYRNYGWVGVVLGAIICALLYSCLIYYSCKRYMYNPIATIIYFSLIVESLRWFESYFDGGISYFAVMIIVFIPLSFIYEKLFMSRNIISKMIKS